MTCDRLSNYLAKISMKSCGFFWGNYSLNNLFIMEEKQKIRGRYQNSVNQNNNI